MSLFLRLLEADDKAAALRETVQAARSSESDARVFAVDPEGFRQVPGAPFAYWVSERVLFSFVEFSAFAAEGRSAVSGGKTLDDFRWIRTNWEFDLTNRDHWKGFAKGGAHSPHYADIHLMLDWRNDARALKAYLVDYRSTRGWSPNWTAELHGSEHYFRPGLTWPRRTNGLSFRVMPAGCIFADKGPAAFVDGDDPHALLALCAVVNSAPFGALVALQLARTELAQSYEVGLIQQTPVPDLTDELANLNLEPSTLHSEPRTLSSLARRAWSLKRSLDTPTENSHAFILPALLQVEGEHLAERAAAWSQRIAKTESELAQIQAEIDDRCFVLYGIDGEDRRQIEHGFGEPADARIATPDEEDATDDGPDSADQAPLTAALLSWTVGVAFARFDPRLATGERAIPPEPEPFDPLPARSPGMYPEGEEPADRPDILVDDQGHADDLAARVRAVAERVKVDVPESLRAWLAKAFFPLHIRMYSKSRRKAPIYWQLATPSASYSVWLYIHAFTKDTLFRVQNDYVAPKLAHEERRLESLNAEQRDGATATERKALAEQQALVEELRAFLAEVKRVAPLWKPNLDDGVIINFAPLWRLVPQHKAWQKELKKTWDVLCDGKYDWAHLAMHLWPERVVPKCAKDRSLAIAHGLEDVFWVEESSVVGGKSSVVSRQSSGEESSVVGQRQERRQPSAGDSVAEDGRPTTEDSKPGKWQPRKVPQSEIDRLVAERTSAAVKDALKGLLEAPAPITGRGGGRKSPARGPSRRASTGPRSGNGGGRAPSSAGPAAPDAATLDAVKLAIAASNGAASKADVLAGTGLSDAQWTAAINVLLVDGSVTKIGAGRGTRYRLTTDNRH